VACRRGRTQQLRAQQVPRLLDAARAARIRLWLLAAPQLPTRTTQALSAYDVAWITPAEFIATHHDHADHPVNGRRTHPQPWPTTCELTTAHSQALRQRLLAPHLAAAAALALLVADSGTSPNILVDLILADLAHTSAAVTIDGRNYQVPEHARPLLRAQQLTRIDHHAHPADWFLAGLGGRRLLVLELHDYFTHVTSLTRIPMSTGPLPVPSPFMSAD
jgi:hypothetical protein